MTHRLRREAGMTTLLEPEIIRAGGKPPPNPFEGDAPAPAPETEEAEEGREEEG
jgi:hypothetical protein